MEANELYATYKTINAQALTTFDNNSLDQSICLREEYARKFLDYEDTGAHSVYIRILKRVRAVEWSRRRMAYNRWMTESTYFADFVHV